tara:strand:+ start:1223 stop:1495 length:273 start_codon:yes stop_codon:yes gene_type:complete
MTNKNDTMYKALTDFVRVAKVKLRNDNRHIPMHNYMDHREIPTSIMDFVENVCSSPVNEVSIEEINDFLNSYDEWCIDQDVKHIVNKHKG